MMRVVEGEITSTTPNGAALEAAGFVGTWTTDVTAGLSILEGQAAAMLSGDDQLAGRPTTLDVAFGRIHPDDRKWVFNRIRQTRITGGPFSAEFRILDTGGSTRWILNRGCIKPDASGAMRGCGAYLDTTDSHNDMTPSSVSRPYDFQDPLDEAADRCLQLRAAVDRSGHDSLLLLTDMLLLELGRALTSCHRA